MAFNKIFTNVLTKTEMGRYAIFISAITTIFTYSTLGFPAALNRFTVSYKERKQLENLKNFLTTGFIIFLTAELTITSILIILYYTTGFTPKFLNIEPYIITLIIVSLVAITQIFSTMCYVIASALQNSRYYAIIMIMRVFLQIPFGFLFVVFLNLGVFGLILGLLLSEFIVALYSFYYLVKDVGIGKFSWKEGKAMLSFSVPGYIAAIFISSFDLGLKVFVDYVFPVEGKEIIALYQYGALAVVNILLVAGNLFRVVYRPIIFKYFEQKRNREIQTLTITISKLFTITIVFSAIFLFAFSPLLIPFLTKSSYLSSISVIPILMLSTIIGYLRTLITYGHTLYYKNYWNAIAAITAIIISAILGYFIIPTLGLIGLGLVYLSLTSIQFFILFFVSQHYFKVKFEIKLIIKILVLCGVSIGTGIIFNVTIFSFSEYSLIYSFLLSSFIYIIGIFPLKLVGKKDIDFLKSVIKTYINIIKSKNSLEKKNSKKRIEIKDEI